MKKVMVAKTLLIIANTLFALALLLIYPNFGKVDQMLTSRAVYILQTCSTIDTNQLARYLSENGLASPFDDPMRLLEERAHVTFGIWTWVLIPAACLLLANAILIEICWKRQSIDKGDRPTPPAN